MFELTQINPNQFLRGWLYTDWQNKPTEKRFFKYEILDPKNRGLSEIVQNLWLDGANVVIRTNYLLPFKLNNVVELQDGKLYTISNVVVDTNEVNSQSMRFLKHNPNTVHTIALTERVGQ